MSDRHTFTAWVAGLCLAAAGTAAGAAPAPELLGRAQGGAFARPKTLPMDRPE